MEQRRPASASEVARRLRALHGLTKWGPDEAGQWWEMHFPELPAGSPLATATSLDNSAAA
jgi:hypothetical protein